MFVVTDALSPSMQEEVMEIRRLQNTPTRSPTYPQPRSMGKMSGASPQGALSPPQHGIPVLRYSPSPLGPHAAAADTTGVTPGSSSQLHPALSQPLPVDRGMPRSPQQPSAVKGYVVEWGGPLAPASPPSSHSQPSCPLVPQPRPLANQFLPPTVPFVSQFALPSPLSTQPAVKQSLSNQLAALPAKLVSTPGLGSLVSSQASFVFASGQLQTSLSSSAGQPSHVSGVSPTATAPPPQLFQFGQIQSLGTLNNSPFQFSSPSPPPSKVPAPAMFGPSAAKQPAMFGPSAVKQLAVTSILDVGKFSALSHPAAPPVTSPGMGLERNVAPVFQQSGTSPFAVSAAVPSLGLTARPVSSSAAAIQPSNASPLVPPSGPIFKPSPASKLDGTFSFAIPTSTPLSTSLAGPVCKPSTSVSAGPVFKPLLSANPLGVTPMFTTSTVSTALPHPIKPLFTTSTADVLTKTSTSVSFNFDSMSSGMFVSPPVTTVSSTTLANVSLFHGSHKPLSATRASFTLTPASAASTSLLSFPPPTAVDSVVAVSRLAPSFSLSSTGGGMLLATSTPVSKPPLLASPVLGPPIVSQFSNGEEDTSFNTSAEFAPVVSLAEVNDLKSGEEEDTVLFSHKAKLYRFENAGQQWKERGVGTIKILQHTPSGRFRVLMRRDQIFKICCNHTVTRDMTLKSFGSESRAWLWYTPSDFADEVPKPEKFVVKFKQVGTARSFQKAFLKATGGRTSPTEESGSDEPASSSITSITSEDGTAKQKTGSSKLEGSGPPALMASLGWSCKLCSARNLARSLLCSSCGASQSPSAGLPRGPHRTAQSVPPSKPLVASQPGLGSWLKDSAEMFAPPPGSWSCSTCLLQNKDGTAICAACQSPRTGATDTVTWITLNTSAAEHTLSGPSSSVAVSDKQQQQTSESLLAKFAPPQGSWSCDVCLVQNKAGNTECVACQTPKPGTISSKSNLFPTTTPPVTTTQEPSAFGSSGGVKIDLLQGRSLSSLVGTCDSAQQAGGTRVSGSVTGGMRMSLLQGVSLSSVTGAPCSTGTTSIMGGAKLGGGLSLTPSIVAGQFHTDQEEEDEKEETSEEEDDQEGSADDADISGSSAGSAYHFTEFPSDDDDVVVIVAVEMPPEDLVKRAEEYQLPAGFYLYERKPPCPGCRGCDDQLEGLHLSELSTSTSQPSVQRDPIMPPPTSQTAGSSGHRLFASISQSSALSFGGLATQQSDFSLQFTETGEQSFSISTKPLFSSPARDESSLEGEAGVHFKPLVSLPKLDKIETGEEDEKVLFCQRAKLFRFDNKANQWKERGLGEMKVLQNKVTGKGRLVMRREQILKLCCNHTLSPELSLTPHSNTDKAWTWFTPSDLSEDEPRPEKFAVRFKNKKFANEFKEAFCRGCGHKELDSRESNTGDDNDEDDTEVRNENEGQLSFPTSDAKSSTDQSRQEETLVSKPQVGSKTLGADLPSFGGLFKTTNLPSFADVSSQQNMQSPFNFSALSSSEKSFTFSLANKPLFASPTSKDDDDGRDEEGVPEEEPTVFFKPLVSLPKLEDISTGEEGEEVLFCSRAKLFRLNQKTREWKERGVGEIKILKHRVSRKTRVLMRREQILKICCNHGLVVGMFLKPMGTQGKAWTWITPCDYADEAPQSENFSVKFKTPEIADRFRKAFETAVSSDSTSEDSSTACLDTIQARDVKDEEEGQSDEKGESDREEESEGEVDQQKEGTEEENEDGDKDTSGVLSDQELDDEQVGDTEASANIPPSDQTNFTPSFKSPFDLGHGLKLLQEDDSQGLPSSTTTTSSIVSSVVTAPPCLASPKAHLQGEALATSLLPHQTPHDRVGMDEQELFSAPAVLCDLSKVSEHEGVMHVLHDPDQKHVRVLMRSSAPDSHILCSHVVTSLMSLRKGTPCSQHPGGVAWSWSASADYSTGHRQNSWFSVSFPDEETASDFHDAFNSSSLSVVSALELQPVSDVSEEEEDNKDNVLPDATQSKSIVAAADDDVEGVEFVHEVFPEEELIRKAEELQLPRTFYLYLQKPPCPGCRGCGEDPIIEYEVESPSSLEVTAVKEETCILQTGGSQSELHSSGQESEVPRMSSLFTSSSSVGFSSFSDLASRSDSGFGQSSEGFQFAGAGRALFAQSSKPHEDGDKEDPERETDVHFQPLVQLPEHYCYQSSEKNAEELFCQRGKLYRHDPTTKQWKERGLGNMRILRNHESGMVQLLMRREQTLKVCCNHIITGEMDVWNYQESNKAMLWGTPADYSDEQPKEQKFIIRFKHDETASEFKMLFEQAVQNARCPLSVCSKPLKQLASSQPDVTRSDQGGSQWECPTCSVRNEPREQTCQACNGKKEVEEVDRDENESQDQSASIPPLVESSSQSEVSQPALSDSQDARQHQSLSQCNMPPLEDMDSADAQAAPHVLGENTDS